MISFYRRVHQVTSTSPLSFRLARRSTFVAARAASSAAPLASYDHGVSSDKMIGITIGKYFDQQVAKHADVDALIVKHQNIRWTYSELAEKVNIVAQNLLNYGIRPGDRVGIWAPNCYEWTIIQFATAKMGAIIVNINPAYQRKELHYALNKVEIKCLIMAPNLKTSNYIEMITDICPELASHHPEKKLITKEVPSLEIVFRLGEEKTCGMYNFGQLLDDNIENDTSIDIVEIGEALQCDDPQNIQFTSGTTGNPKGATLSHHNILNNGFFCGGRLQYDVGDRVCIAVPLYHCFGMVIGNLACLSKGATMVYPAEVFDPLATLQTLQDEKCVSLLAVPTMILAQLEHPRFNEFNMTSLRTGVLAGTLCPSHLMVKVQTLMHMKEVTICYGMTETSPVSTQTNLDDPFEKRISTVGRVHPNCELKVVNPENGRIIPRGETGELKTRGYCVMKGYWDDDERTKAAICADGWMSTGDLASMDDEGYITIEGRLKDLVIRGGENIYPKEVEQFLYTHEAIQDVQVVGVPDEKYGEELCAWIILRENIKEFPTEESIRDFCRGQISHYKIPRYVRFVTEFPFTISGKVKKFEIRNAMIQELRLSQSDK